MNEEKFKKYLGIANHDIQVANGTMELKSYVASILYEIDNLQSKIDKVEKILKYDGIVEDIYYALCMLFGFEYYDDETMIDKELRNIIKEDK